MYQLLTFTAINMTNGQEQVLFTATKESLIINMDGTDITLYKEVPGGNFVYTKSPVGMGVATGETLKASATADNASVSITLWC